MSANTVMKSEHYNSSVHKYFSCEGLFKSAPCAVKLYRTSGIQAALLGYKARDH